MFDGFTLVFKKLKILAKEKAMFVECIINSSLIPPIIEKDGRFA